MLPRITSNGWQTVLLSTKHSGGAKRESGGEPSPVDQCIRINIKRGHEEI
jgi:hypothetical protein